MAATLPLNTFKTVTVNLTTSTQTPYTAPVNVTSIVLMAQVSNIDSTTHYVTASHYDGTNATALVNHFAIAAFDAASILTGKLILETGQSIQMSCDSLNAGNTTSMQAVLSILETSNS